MHVVDANCGQHCQACAHKAESGSVTGRQVSIEEGDAKAREFNVMFIETSAKAGFNIKVPQGQQIMPLYSNSACCHGLSQLHVFPGQHLALATPCFAELHQSLALADWKCDHLTHRDMPHHIELHANNSSWPSINRIAPHSPNWHCRAAPTSVCHASHCRPSSGRLRQRCQACSLCPASGRRNWLMSTCPATPTQTKPAMQMLPPPLAPADMPLYSSPQSERCFGHTPMCLPCPSTTKKNKGGGCPPMHTHTSGMFPPPQHEAEKLR